MTQRSRYRLTGRLESGELAELFEALRDDEGRAVVKLLHARTSDPRYARAIAQTQQKLASVEGEGIIRVLEIGMVRGRVGIAREHVDGASLGQMLQRLNTREVILPAPLALYVVLQLAEVVGRAHDAGVTHGAITPGNVVIGRDGRVGIVDFGALEALQSVPELRTFAAKGRSAYRAPELSQGTAPTAVSDVYSLGALAYELLTLREPVPAEKSVSTRHAPLPPPSRLDRRINARLDPILLRALEQSASRRFRSSAEFSNALRSFLSTHGGMPSRPELARVVGELFPNEVQLQPNPQVPFSSPFEFGPIEGAAFVRPESVRETSDALPARASFSRGAIPEALETIKEMPVFEPEQGWEAPPGEAPPARRLALGASAPLPSGISPAVLSRVRVARDFDAEPEERTPAPRWAPTPPVPATVIDHPIADPLEEDDEEVAPEAPSPPPRAMITEERRLWQWKLQRRRFLAVALAFAAVGAFSFGLVVWRFGERVPAPTPVPEPPTPVSRVVEPAPEPERPVPVRSQVEEAESYRAPSGSGAFLLVRANVPARVFVDGKAAGSTPLARLKVAAGKRSIAIESIGTGERRTFSKYFRKGQTVKLEEHFPPAPRR